MSKIVIERNGQRIEIDHNAELAPLVAAALEVWEKTKSDKPPAGFANGRKQQ